jgi:carboxylesterase type B
VDEYECLNLVVTAPESAGEDGKLPVMVCTHGGGNLSGRNASWFNDGGALVARSVQLGKPIVFVGLNYRLGSLGWLASTELFEDNRKAGDKGVGNYGIRDVHNGLEWVYRNIAPFGGNPNNITLLGESAGSMDVLHQIHTILPGRFHRAILQSGIIGTPTMAVPSTTEEQDEWYETAKKFVKVGSLEDMRKLPVSAFDRVGRATTPPGSVLCRFTIDDVHCSRNWRERNASADPANFELMIGDCEAEYTVWESSISILRKMFPLAITPVPTPEFLDSLFQVAPKSKIEAILTAYGITPESEGTEMAYCILQLLNDFNFAEPTQTYAKTASAKGLTVYRYLFDELNPFGGPSFNCRANHSLDLPYIYGAPSLFDNVEHPDWEKHVSEVIQEKFIGFAHGEKVWRPFGERGYFAFGPKGKAREIGEEEARKRRGMEKWGYLGELSAAEKKAFAIACAKHMMTLI